MTNSQSLPLTWRGCPAQTSNEHFVARRNTDNHIVFMAFSAGEESVCIVREAARTVHIALMGLSAYLSIDSIVFEADSIQ